VWLGLPIYVQLHIIGQFFITSQPWFFPLVKTTMKRNRLSLLIPQHEFGFVPDRFTLIQDTGLDGERLARERAEAARRFPSR